MFKIGSHLTQKCLVFGCGNPLFGDDGFGGKVIEYLGDHHPIPPHVSCLDVGTSIRDLLFDIILSPTKPEQIVIVDAMDIAGGIPGQIYEIDVEQIHPAKTCDFSLHQFPTTNMLKEICEGTKIRVRVMVVQPNELPEEVNPGLTPEVAAAVPEMCRRILGIITEPAAGELHQGGRIE